MDTETRIVVVNADDLGLSAGVNRGIFHAHEQGILTSASLMVRQPGLDEAVAYCDSHDSLGVGLHLDLGEWRLSHGEWKISYEVVDLQNRLAIEREVARQIAIFCERLGRKPTHLDSHQHVHRREPVKSIVQLFAEELCIPLRSCGFVHYCGGFYGQLEDGASAPWMIGSEHLIRLLQAMPNGVTEVGCHPGFADDLDSDYRDERSLEVATLCDPNVRAAIEQSQIKLRTFAQLRS